MLIAVILFAVGLVLLIKGGDWFVDGATGIAERFHIPELLIGATVVSIGTTLPEVMVSATSAFKGIGAMAYGNAVGSVICNTALVAALTVAIRPGKVDKSTFSLPVVFFFIAAAIYAVVSYTTGEFTRPLGIALLVMFVVYIAVSAVRAVKGKGSPEEAEPDAEEPDRGIDVSGIIIFAAMTVIFIVASFLSDGGLNAVMCTALSVSLVLYAIFSIIRAGRIKKAALSGNTAYGGSAIGDIVLLAVGAAVIAVGARLLVDNGTVIAEKLGVPSSVIALTFVALGTSLPELVTAITSLAKGHSALSLGNIVGANLFNIVLVSGTSITIKPFSIPAEKLIAGHNASLVVDLPVMLAVMALLTVPTLIRGKLGRVQGILLLAIYAGFCVFQFAF